MATYLYSTTGFGMLLLALSPYLDKLLLIRARNSPNNGGWPATGHGLALLSHDYFPNAPREYRPEPQAELLLHPLEA